jgi:hypothetical protein
MRLHADRQRAHAADQQPGVERRQLAAEIGIGFGLDARDHLLRAGDDAGHDVAVAAEIFRGRMDDEIDAERQRPLEERACPAVVDHRDDAVRLASAASAPTSCASITQLVGLSM